MSAAFTWELPRDSTAPAQGRWYVRDLASNDTGAVDAELVATELITNAWKHGRGDSPITLRAEIGATALRIQVCGEAEGDPIRTFDNADSDPSGRGLLMIDELASAWGFERHGDTVCVWAEVPHMG